MNGKKAKMLRKIVKGMAEAANVGEEFYSSTYHVPKKNCRNMKIYDAFGNVVNRIPTSQHGGTVCLQKCARQAQQMMKKQYRGL